MSVITKISCYLECSVVTLKLRKEYLSTVTHYTSVLLWINKRLCYCRGTARRATSVEILWPFFD